MGMYSGLRSALGFGPNGMGKLFAPKGLQSQDELPLVLSPRDGWVMQDDFTNFYSAGVLQSTFGWHTVLSNGSQNVSNSPDGRAGIWRLIRGTTAPARSVIYSAGNDIVFAGAKTYFEASVNFPILSTGTDDFETYIGFGDVGGIGDQANNVSFHYNEQTGGDFWEAHVRGGSSETSEVLDGGGGRETSAIVADTWYRLGIEIDDITGGGTPAVRFYVDGVLKSTITTNIPTTGEDVGIQLAQEAAAADTVAANREVKVDYVYAAQVFTTRR